MFNERGLFFTFLIEKTLYIHFGPTQAHSNMRLNIIVVLKISVTLIHRIGPVMCITIYNSAEVL